MCEKVVISVVIVVMFPVILFSDPCKMKDCEDDALVGYSFCKTHKCVAGGCVRSGRWIKPPSWTKYCIYYHRHTNQYFTDGSEKKVFWAKFCGLHSCKYQGPVVTDINDKPKVRYKKGVTPDSDIINLFSCDNEKTLKYKYCKRHVCPERLCASPVQEKIEGHQRILSKYCQKHRRANKNMKEPDELETASDRCAKLEKVSESKDAKEAE